MNEQMNEWMRWEHCCFSLCLCLLVFMASGGLIHPTFALRICGASFWSVSWSLMASWLNLLWFLFGTTLSHWTHNDSLCTQTRTRSRSRHWAAHCNPLCAKKRVNLSVEHVESAADVLPQTFVSNLVVVVLKCGHEDWRFCCCALRSQQHWMPHTTNGNDWTGADGSATCDGFACVSCAVLLITAPSTASACGIGWIQWWWICGCPAATKFCVNEQNKQCDLFKQRKKPLKVVLVGSDLAKAAAFTHKGLMFVAVRTHIGIAGERQSTRSRTQRSVKFELHSLCMFFELIYWTMQRFSCAVSVSFVL